MKPAKISFAGRGHAPPLACLPTMSENAELSERELEVLSLVARGATNKEIATQLSISKNTVKVHLRNIFAKTQSTSRTEAAMHAVRLGLIQPESPAGEPGAVLGLARQERLAPQTETRIKSLWVLVGLLGLALVLVTVATLWSRPQPSEASLSTPPPAPEFAAEWNDLAPLPSPRKGLAVVDFDNQIYAIAGEGEAGVVAQVDRYDPVADRWERLPDKPTAVTDASAVVIGGRIFVPGGREAQGTISARLEIFDPRENRWEAGAPLPRPLSAYAISAFEGRLLLFGGWDGDAVRNQVYEYDPGEDRWQVRTPMPTARSHAVAVVSGERVYVMGGSDGSQALKANEAYDPGLEEQGGSPWAELAPLPEGRSRMGALNVVDAIVVFGGEGSQNTLAALKYFPQADQWQTFDLKVQEPWSDFGFVLLGSHIYALGGEIANRVLPINISYHAIYTIAIPVIQEGGQP